MIRGKCGVAGVSGLRKPAFPASGASVCCYKGGRVEAKRTSPDLYEFSSWEKLCKVIIKNKQKPPGHNKPQDSSASCSPCSQQWEDKELAEQYGRANAGEPGGASVTLLWSLSLLLTHTSEETSLTQN